TGWVGGEQEIGSRGCPFYIAYQSTRTHSHRPQIPVDRRDRIEPAKRHQYAPVGDRRGRRARLSARTRHRCTIGSRASQHLDHFLERLRPCYQIGNEMETGSVRFVGFSYAAIAAKADAHPLVKQTTAADETSGRRSSDSRMASLTSPSTETAASA